MNITNCKTVQDRNLLIASKDTGGDVARVSEDKSYPDVGERLTRVRKVFSDLPRTGWADLHGFNRPQYNHWETGFRRIPIESAEVLCDRYGLSLDFIYRGKLDGCSDSAIRRLSSR